jgi:hypothetical protein
MIRHAPTRRYLLLVCTSIIYAGLFGCVGNRSYRRGDTVVPSELPPAIEPIQATDCGNRPPYMCVQTPDGYQAQHFYLSYIEFDDMGELWSAGNLDHDQGKGQSQLSTTLGIINKAQEVADGQRKELVVIAFVHGWHNNASAYDEEKKDLGSFKTVLQDLSARYLRDFPERPPVLVGVFLSWRGQNLAGNRISSYWNRRDAAVRIGGPSLTDVVTRLMFTVKGVPLAPDPADRCESKGEKEDSHFVAIGHSFGARALAHAVVQPTLALILERQAQAQECIATWNKAHSQESPLTDVSFVAPADLMVFLNAADDALAMKATIEAFKRSQITVLPADHSDPEYGASGPFLISITSDGDWATERVMPIAQWFSMLGLAFRDYDEDACEKGQLCDHSQSYYYRHSAASIKTMRSHTVYDQDMGTAECQKARDTDDDWPYLVATVNGSERCFEIQQNNGVRRDSQGRSYRPWNNTPAFVIGVPRTLIPSHTDVFQDGTVELLITIANHYSDEFTRTTRMSTPAKTPGRP